MDLWDIRPQFGLIVDTSTPLTREGSVTEYGRPPTLMGILTAYGRPQGVVNEKGNNPLTCVGVNWYLPPPRWLDKYCVNKMTKIIFRCEGYNIIYLYIYTHMISVRKSWFYKVYKECFPLKQNHNPLIITQTKTENQLICLNFSLNVSKLLEIRWICVSFLVWRFAYYFDWQKTRKLLMWIIDTEV